MSLYSLDKGIWEFFKFHPSPFLLKANVLYQYSLRCYTDYLTKVILRLTSKHLVLDEQSGVLIEKGKDNYHIRLMDFVSCFDTILTDPPKDHGLSVYIKKNPVKIFHRTGMIAYNYTGTMPITFKVRMRNIDYVYQKESTVSLRQQHKNQEPIFINLECSDFTEYSLLWLCVKDRGVTIKVKGREIKKEPIDYLTRLSLKKIEEFKLNCQLGKYDLLISEGLIHV